MEIVDISRELLAAPNFPGDPAPALTRVMAIEEGKQYNLSVLSLCVHNGTHIDAPAHFIKNGVTAESVPLSKTVGEAEVAEASGDIGRDTALCLTANAPKRLLIKGKISVGLDAAAVFARSLELLGTEELTVGREGEICDAHRMLLGAGVVLLENLDLSRAQPGKYTLVAAPLKIKGADGAPVRAILYKNTECESGEKE